MLRRRALTRCILRSTAQDAASAAPCGHTAKFMRLSPNPLPAAFSLTPHPVAMAAAWACVLVGNLSMGAPVIAQALAQAPVEHNKALQRPSPAPALRLDRQLDSMGKPGDAAAASGATWLEAARIQALPSSQPALPGQQPARRLLAEGAVQFRHAGAVLRADRLDYDSADERVRAQGRVRIERDGAVYSGPALDVRMDSFEGWFEGPRFEFQRWGAGGRAQRLEFLGRDKARAWQADYTSCPRDDAPADPATGPGAAAGMAARAGLGEPAVATGPGKAARAEPAWILSTRRLDLNFAANEGRAEGAVLRFLGVPILAAPTLSFPLNDQRKSGWLPPNVNLDSRSGLGVSVPYYWNIAPNRDATLTPRILARRGVAADVEWRYLEPQHEGLLGLDALPHDRSYGHSRWAWRAEHRTQWDGGSGVPAWLADTRVQWKAARVSDDDWWKDFPRGVASLTPRLLGQSLALERSLQGWGASGQAYARLAHWQVLQSTDAIVSPYQRSPQLGLRLGADAAGGWKASLESEFNRFTLARTDAASAHLPEGWRWHGVASLERPWRGEGWWVQPSLSLHSAYYQTQTQGQGSAWRSLPSFSLDAGATFERQTVFLGRSLRQVLEPRIRYARTPFRDQSQLPNYDSAGKDFNLTSIYSDNAWSGVDRISDSHQLTLGATTRMFRDSDGAEVLRLGWVQRLLIDPQRVTPDDSDPSVQSSNALNRKLSDMLLIGSTHVIPRWTLETTVRYNADTQRAVRSVMGARYAAGDFRSLSAAYRFTRGQTEQIDFGWQWPVGGSSAPTGSSGVPGASGSGSAAGVGSAGTCSGRLYSVGRVNYSLRDSRITDSLLGLEYDSGCWIGRIVAERVSTGRSEATTRLMLQLELVGLSRLGSNPLQVLKDNIPGYRLLREERRESPSTSAFHD